MTIAIDIKRKESKRILVDITDFKICPVEVTATIEAQPFKYTMTSTSD